MLNINFSVYTMLLYVPYLLILTKVMPPENNMILVYSFAVFFLGAFYLLLKEGRRKDLHIKRKNFIFHVAFTIITLLIICIDIIRNQYTGMEIAYNAEALVVIINAFLVYVVFYNVKIPEDKLLKVLRCIIVIGILSCVINIVVNISEILTVTLSTGIYDVSFAGPFISRNTMGIYLFYAIISTVYYLHLTNRKVGKYKYLFFLFAINLVLSFSRGALLSTVVFVMLLFFTKDEWKRRLPFLIVVVLGVVLLLNNNYLRLMFMKFLIRKEAGSSGRFERWKVMLSFAREEPFSLLGVSASGFKKIIYSGLQTLQVDNAYIEILFTYGIVGFVLYIGALASTLRMAIKGLKMLDRRDISFSIICATIAFSLHNLFEGILIFEVGLIQWIGLFLIIVFPRVIYRNRQNEQEYSYGM